MNSNSGKISVRAYGEPEDGNVVVYITKQAYDAIYRHGVDYPDREVGGILVGSVSQDNSGKYHVDIVGIVEAESAPGSLTQMQFTGEVWFRLLESVRARYPEQKVVGWYHSHPNLGVFLSDDDIASHQVAFSHPWHVACVCDPVRKQLSFFGWDGSELKTIKGFYIKELTPMPVRQTKAPMTIRKRTFSLLVPVIILSFALISVVTVYVIIKPLGDQNRNSIEGTATTPALFLIPYPYETALFQYEKKGQIQMYNYFIKKDGTGWLQILKQGEPDTWKQIDKGFGKTLTEITQLAADSSQEIANSIGTLKGQGKDEKGNWDLVAAIKDNGELVWQQPKMKPTQPTPSLLISRPILDFGTTENTTSFHIMVDGVEGLTWSINPVQDWMIVKHGPISKNTLVTVEINRNSLPVGYQHEGKISINYDSMPTKDISVLVTAPGSVPKPKIEIISIMSENGDKKIFFPNENVIIRTQNKGDEPVYATVEVSFDKTFFIVADGTRSTTLQPNTPLDLKFLVSYKEQKPFSDNLTCTVRNPQKSDDIYAKREETLSSK